MKNRKFLIGIGFGTLLSIVLIGGVYSLTRGGSIQAVEDTGEFNKAEDTVMYEKNKLTLLDTIIDKYYIDQEEAFELVEGIYTGYVYGLEDPYTRYLSEEEFNKTTAQDRGNHVGVGIQFTWGITNQHLIVTNVIEGSPADEVGIKVGDKIIEIDGIRAMASNEVEIYEKLTYAGKDAVEYVFVDNDEENERRIELVPEEVQIQIVESDYLEGDIGYVKLHGLVEGTTEEIEKVFEEHIANGATRLILDLRSSYSNDIAEAVDLADLFLDAQTICGVQDKQGDVTEYTTTEGALTQPLAVLVNSGTSGAVEATVSALKNEGRAVIVGQETAGHGTLQQRVELEDGSGLDIATGLILDSNDKVIRDNPIQPDVIQRIAMDNTLELVTTGTIDKMSDVVIQKAIESLQ